jgi:DNA-binding protein H-NS
MDSEALHVRVQYLEQKIMQLLEHHKNQQEVIQQLRKENEQLAQKVTNRAEITYDFPNMLEIYTITKKKKRGDTQAWEARIDSYISDIDKSIAYLERVQ